MASPATLALRDTVTHACSLAPSADWFFGGDENGDQVGYSVGSAGDVNGDGYGEVVIGAPRDGLTTDREGVVSLFYGKQAGLPDEVDWQAGSGQRGSLFGAAVAAAGDVNGDGYDDVLIGAPAFSDGVNAKGAAFLFFGSAAGLESEPAWSTVGTQKDGLEGHAVAGAGDVNGDGYADLIVGVPGWSAAAMSEGAAYLFFGSAGSISQTPDWSYYGGVASAQLGASVAGAGDVNGDGYDDILVGAPGYSVDHTGEGTILLFLGGDTGLDPAPDWQALGGQPGARLGTSVSSAGDVNGDGYDDLLAGAPHPYAEDGNPGEAFLFYGRAPLPSQHVLLSIDHREAVQFGRAVGGSGDADGDGYDDVLVGAYLFTFDQRQEGAAFLFYGSAGGLKTQAGWHAEGDKADTEFGYSVDVVPRLRGEGPASLVIGAPRYRQGTDPEGRAFVFYGPLSARHYFYLPLVSRQHAAAGMPVTDARQPAAREPATRSSRSEV
ncbi:MAG TPA: integrin alpha [Anaerolineae bacterium]|nr:integrin alpha [Anaerolineae bacterium]